MINILYSLLVSGVDTIPESYPAYRRYFKVGFKMPGIADYTDPYRRSLWANYIIELAKLSPLYSAILERDPSNTYHISPAHPDSEAKASNGHILRISPTHPVAVGTVKIVDDVAICSVNNNDMYLPVTPDDTVDVLGNTIHITDKSRTCSYSIQHTGISFYIPTAQDIRAGSKSLSEGLKCNVDWNSPYDRACALGVLALDKFMEV